MAMERRDFLRLGASGLAIAMLPMTGCVAPGTVVVERGPGALAIADDGTRYELLSASHCLLITEPGGTPRRVGQLGTAAGELNYPIAAAVLGELVYVVELGNHRVQAFDRAGQSRGVFASGELAYPSGITARGDRLVVADTAHASLVELAASGEVIRRFGQPALRAPRGVAPLGGHLVVADAGRRDVLELGDDGAVIRTFDGDWVLPWGVAADRDTVYTTDRARLELAVFDRGGQRIDTVRLTGAAGHLTLAGGELWVS